MKRYHREWNAQGGQPLRPYPGERRWRSSGRLRQGMLSRSQREWLLDAGSLTSRLRRVCDGDFRVRLLSQRWERPMASERQALGLRGRRIALVRQVCLLCKGEARVYARTVIPGSTLSGGQRGLARLGGRPLGEMLFRDKSMRRVGMEVAEVAEGERLFELVVPRQPAGFWGRRSVFYLQGKPLLVSEFFLAPLLPPLKGRFRVTGKR